jgi:hypothetical protein
MPEEPETTKPESEETPEAPEAPETEGEKGAQPEAEAAWAPSKEEWQEVTQGMKQLMELANAPEEEEEDDDFDPATADLGQLMERYVQNQLQPILPYVESAARSAGEQREAKEFERLSKEVGEFDPKMAHAIAESIYQETGDPETALEQGAKMAAEYRKAQREEAIAEYKASQKGGRGGDLPDPGATSSGFFGEKPAKSYDEVTERWAKETEL